MSDGHRPIRGTQRASGKSVETNDEPRYCKKCGIKLSRYNRSKNCFLHDTKIPRSLRA